MKLSHFSTFLIFSKLKAIEFLSNWVNIYRFVDCERVTSLSEAGKGRGKNAIDRFPYLNLKRITVVCRYIYFFLRGL